MQHLGAADAVDDFNAEMLRPALPDVLRQGFARGRAQAQSHVAFLRQVGAGEHAAVAGGRTVEHGGLVVVKRLKQACGWRVRPSTREAPTRAGRQRIARRRQEELAAEHGVVFAQVQHALAISSAVSRGWLRVHALWGAGGAGEYSQNAVVAVGVGRVGALRGWPQVLKWCTPAGRASVRVRRPGASLRWVVPPARLQRGQQPADTSAACAAVGQMKA